MWGWLSEKLEKSNKKPKNKPTWLFNLGIEQGEKCRKTFQNQGWEEKEER